MQHVPPQSRFLSLLSPHPEGSTPSSCWGSPQPAVPSGDLGSGHRGPQIPVRHFELNFAGTGPDVWLAWVMGTLQGGPAHRPLPLSLSTDVKFISNPPSMVAAGSVVAAVQGLHLGSSSGLLSYHRLTRFLSKVIKCDPVSDPCTSAVWPDLASIWP